MATPYQYLYGPVPSRRLGRSLGVDLVPSNICCLECVFCQLGATGRKTTKRRCYGPTAEIVNEIEDWCQAGGDADYLDLVEAHIVVLDKT